MGNFEKIVDPRRRKRLRRKKTIRKSVSGTAERPRLSVFRSAKHIYAQAIDDTSGKVVASACDLQKSVQTTGTKTEAARAVGEFLGKVLIEKNIEKVVFDRNGFLYHGRVKEVAEGARAAGLKF